jgi:hypothetical protein
VAAATLKVAMAELISPPAKRLTEAEEEAEDEVVEITLSEEVAETMITGKETLNQKVSHNQPRPSSSLNNYSGQELEEPKRYKTLTT